MLDEPIDVMDGVEIVAVSETYGERCQHVYPGINVQCSETGDVIVAYDGDEVGGGAAQHVAYCQEHVTLPDRAWEKAGVDVDGDSE